MKNINTKARNKNVVKLPGPIEGLSWAVFQVTPERTEQLLIAFAQWSKLEDSLQLEWFFEAERITEDIWDALCERDERFRVLNKHVRSLIGARREKRMWEFKMNTQVALPTQHYFSSSFKRAYDEKVALQKELKDKTSPEKVVIVLGKDVDTGIAYRKVESKDEDLQEISQSTLNLSASANESL